MNTAGRNEDWTGAQLAARLATLEGAAPEAMAYLVWRSTTGPGGEETQVFQAADEPGPFAQGELPGWLARNRLRGAERLGLALLAIREVVDEAGLIRECTLERRRGALDGPLFGDPARVEFTGAARMVRFYRVLRDGRLIEVAGATDTLPARHHAPGQLPGEMAALRARFGPEMRVIDTREPTLFETMIGCDTIMHVRLGDGREIGCGIGWHGPVPYVLAAAFPRFGAPLALSLTNEAAVQAALLRDNLARHETRLDHAGPAVMARRRLTQALFLLRAADGTVQIEAYEPAPEAAGSEDQASWMHYAETYEHLAILDAWRDNGSDDLLVITGEASGQIWRHQIDSDGVETWRRPDEESAAGLLYRDRLVPGTLAVADASAPDAGIGDAGIGDARIGDARIGDASSAGAHAAASLPPPHAIPELADDPDPPPDSLLAKAGAYVTAVAALHDAQEAVAEAASPEEVLAHLRLLQPALQTLQAETAMAELQALLTQAEASARPARLASALARIAARLPDELATTRLMLLAPAQWRHMADPAPFGRAVEDAFPEAAYDIEEAALCLAFRRPTAVAFHSMRVIEAGLTALGTALNTDLPGEDRQWSQVMARIRRAATATHADLLRALDQVRRCWRGTRLAPAVKCTEAEAERLFSAVGVFMRELADTLG